MSQGSTPKIGHNVIWYDSRGRHYTQYLGIDEEDRTKAWVRDPVTDLGVKIPKDQIERKSPEPR